jgi:hypothetical protein
MEPKSESKSVAQVDQAQHEIPVELLSLSAQEIMDRASATTQVLNEMLEREDRARDLRHWGINE